MFADSQLGGGFSNRPASVDVVAAGVPVTDARKQFLAAVFALLLLRSGKERTHAGIAGQADDEQLVMRDAIRQVLHHHLSTNERVTLWGEDIDDPKGDVFGVTKGLGSEFGRRVQNSPLSESTIVGVSAGRALAGGRPVAFLQFADFLPLAYNQIVSELGSMHWRTDGRWTAPVIVMVPELVKFALCRFTNHPLLLLTPSNVIIPEFVKFALF